MKYLVGSVGHNIENSSECLSCQIKSRITSKLSHLVSLTRSKSVNLQKFLMGALEEKLVSMFVLTKSWKKLGSHRFINLVTWST